MAIKLPKKFPGMTYAILVSSGNGTGMLSTNTAPGSKRLSLSSANMGSVLQRHPKSPFWMTLTYFTVMQRFLPSNPYLSDSHMMSKNSHL